MYLPCGISANATATCVAQLAKCQGPQAKKNASLATTKGPKSFRNRICILIHLCVGMKYYLVSQCTQDYKSGENVGKKPLCKDFNLIVTQLSQMVGQQSLMYQKLDRIACTATQLACLKHKIGLFSDVVFQGQGLILLADRPTQ